MSLQILTLPQFVGGKFVNTYLVVDENNNPVGSKAHKEITDAETEMGNLKYYATGLEFARATASEGATEKGRCAKANVVAAYLMYVEQQENGGAEAAELEAAVEAAVEAPEGEDESF